MFWTSFVRRRSYRGKHAIKVLRGTRAPYCRSGRPRKYGREVTPVLKDLYLALGQPCSKAEIPRRRRSPVGVAAVKRAIPIRGEAWDVEEPGWMEADTVAHSGGNREGNFVWSLTLTDIQTQWTEVRCMWNRGAAATHERIEQIERALPFAVRGFDSDNGPEFMNWHLHRYFRNRRPPVEFTRSRAYHKNDNAHVEQKNGTHVREILGHERIDDIDCVEALNEALRLWSLSKNLYRPVMKLVHKVREGGRYRKR
mgnify:FL=1